MNTAGWDVTQEIQKGKKRTSVAMKQDIYREELDRLFYGVRQRFEAFDEAFLNKETAELDQGLKQVIQQFKGSGVKASLISKLGTMLVRSGQCFITDESFKKCDRDRCILFVHQTGEPEKLVFNMSKRWTLTVSRPNGKKSVIVYAIMAFRDEEDVVQMPKGLTKHSSDDVYTAFPRFVLYAAKEGDSDDLLVPITIHLCLIQESVKAFVSHVFD